MKKSDLTKLIAIGAAVTAAAATTAIVISKHKKHKTMLAEHTKTLTKKQAYITGGGLSAFASALYLVRDCGFTPENIHIYKRYSRLRQQRNRLYLPSRKNYKHQRQYEFL